MASDYASVALQAGDQVAWSALFGVLQPNIAPICRYVYPNNPDAVDSDLVDPTPVFHAVLAVLKADVPNLEAGETGARRNSVSHTT